MKLVHDKNKKTEKDVLKHIEKKEDELNLEGEFSFSVSGLYRLRLLLWDLSLNLSLSAPCHSSISHTYSPTSLPLLLLNL